MFLFTEAKGDKDGTDKDTEDLDTAVPKEGDADFKDDTDKSSDTDSLDDTTSTDDASDTTTDTTPPSGDSTASTPPATPPVSDNLYSDGELLLDNLVKFIKTTSEAIEDIKNIKTDSDNTVNEIYKRAILILEKAVKDTTVLIKKFNSLPIKTANDLYINLKQSVITTLKLIEQHIDNDESNDPKSK